MKAVDKIEEFAKFGSILGLERMTALMERLGNPQNGLKYIHVAGTNGKGSVCRYIYEALQANGYKVGIYTSPFLEVFNERIEFNGEMISDEDLAEITETVLAEVDKMVGEGEDSPTEFEVITAIAFVYFAKKKADFVILEVGLGGRGDSTNIIKDPLMTIITSISLDHTDRLGKTLSAIAGEKAGIIKEGCPLVTSVKAKEALETIARKAYEKGAVLHDSCRFKYGNVRKTLEGTTFDTVIDGTDYSDVTVCMPGDHQIENVMAALTALEILRKKGEIKVERSRLYAGIKKARQIGRFEIMEKDPYVILDGAHNEDGTRALRETMENFFSGKKILMGCGMLKDKDTTAILDNFTAFAGDFIITEPDNPRKLATEDLKDLLEKRGRKCLLAGTPAEICEYAKAHKNEYDAVIFAGSLYLIGEIRGIVKKWTK